MAYVKAQIPSEVYHLTKEKNLDSILNDGKIRRFNDTECWFCESLAKMRAHMEQTVLCEGKPYLKGGQNAAKLAQRTRYFATRPGVELLADEHSALPATKKQCSFINRLVSAYDNYLRVGCELQLCPVDAMASEIVTRGEAAQLLHAILTQSFTVEVPPAPVKLENPTGVHANDFLLELRRVPEPILAAFNESGWTYRIDFDFMADLSDRLDMSCIGATSYGKKIIYVSDAKATVHEFGHFLDGALGFPAEHERLYLAEAQNSGLRDYAKTNNREYFADCFAYWITYGGNEKRMETFRNAAPKTYAYMEKLAANNWGC